MKRIIYSSVLKIIAVVLFVFNITFGAYTCFRGIVELNKEEIMIYDFETEFSESRHMSNMMSTPFDALYGAYSSYHRVDPDDGSTVEPYIEKMLEEIYNADKLNYYIKWNDTVFTNCGAADGRSLATGDFYILVERSSDNTVHRESTHLDGYSYYYFDEISRYDKTSEITVSVNIKSDYVEECSELWSRQAQTVYKTIMNTLYCIIFALVAFVYLLCVCGKNKNGEQISVWVDNVWTEIHLAFIAGAVLGATFLFITLIESLYMNQPAFDLYLLNPVLIIAMVVASTVFLTSSLSVARNIKCKRFLSSTLIFIILKFTVKIIIAVFKWIYNHLKVFFVALIGLFSKKSGLILIFALSVYSFIIFIFGVLTYEAPFFILSAGVIFLLAAFFIGYKSKDVDEIKKGVFMIRNGNVSYKIPKLKSVDMDMLVNNINDIGKGLDESVKAQVKAERMKTELITNVSHDLKTPITSVINYAELLSKADGLSEEARDYVNIISKKAERLKKLTQDLFDISKVQSGNENIALEKIDLSVLIGQSLAENESDIENSEIPFCVNTQKELFINADGRKMSRVVNNLINNILKYSLKNTRAFISAYEKDGYVITEFKNIASYPMNFNAEDIVGRFVRGDESRTTDGNGLGLAIAKSYTEACGGCFEIIVDGDMFKAIIKFEKC